MALEVSGLSALSNWAARVDITLRGFAPWRNFQERAGSELIGLQAGSRLIEKREVM